MSPAVRHYLEALAAKAAADLASDQAARDARKAHAQLTAAERAELHALRDRVPSALPGGAS